MAVKVIELHHHGIRVSPESGGPEKALAFYRDVLGLDPDPGRPHIAAVPGYWMEVGGRAQIHLMGVEDVHARPRARAGPHAPARRARRAGHSASWSAWACRTGASRALRGRRPSRCS